MQLLFKSFHPQFQNKDILMRKDIQVDWVGDVTPGEKNVFYKIFSKVICSTLCISNSAKFTSINVSANRQIRYPCRSSNLVECNS